MKESKIGTVIRVDKVQTFDSGFQKREFVIETNEEYPQKLKFELIKEKVDLIKERHLNRSVEVHYNIRGSEWKDRFFVNLVAWKVDDLVSTAENMPTSKEAEDALNGDENDDVPF